MMRAFRIATFVIFFASGFITGRNYALAAAAPGQAPVPAPVPVTPPPQAPAAPRPPTPGAQAQRPEEQLRIVADPATNSLIIYGTAQEFHNIKNILKELDIVPRQVLLDVLVAEVTLTDNQSLGVDYSIMENRPERIFGQQFGSAGAARSLGSFFPSTGQFGNGATAVFGNGAVRAIINALATDSRAKILSSPSVLATDNRPARIQVGSEQPIPTGTITAAVGQPTVSSSTTIQYRNTGRIVTIIPQVNSQGLVNLQILAEVSQPGAPVTIGTESFPAFDTRQAETTAVVQDGDTLGIGGIIADNRTRSRTGIPYLMDLPVIGRFFGTASDQLTRTELIMLITPHVIRNRDQAQQVTEDLKKSLSTIRNELERISREREKLQKKPLREKPALPGPSGDVAPAPNLPATPAPAPSAAPSGAGAPMAPTRKIAPDSTASASGGKMVEQMVGPAPAVGAEAIQRAPTKELAVAESPQRTDVPATQAQRAYALSITRRTDVKSDSATQKPTGSKPDLRSSQPWTVQVAARPEKQEAEAIANMLRAKGYDAYVVTANVNGKTWHRVRVGRLSLADASKLQRTLKLSEKFESAYVTQ